MPFSVNATGWQLVTIQTFDPATFLSISNCFSATYDHYFVTQNLISSAYDTEVRVQMRTTSGDDTTSNYNWQYINGDGASPSAGRQTGLTYFPQIFYTERTNVMIGSLHISHPFAVGRTSCITFRSLGVNATAIRLLLAGYSHSGSTSHTGITFYPSSGTIGGKIAIYGLKSGAST